MDALEFNHVNWTNIYVKLHDEELRHWKFWHLELKKRHYVSFGVPSLHTWHFHYCFLFSVFRTKNWNMETKKITASFWFVNVKVVSYKGYNTFKIVIPTLNMPILKTDNRTVFIFLVLVFRKTKNWKQNVIKNKL